MLLVTILPIDWVSIHRSKFNSTHLCCEVVRVSVRERQSFLATQNNDSAKDRLKKYSGITLQAQTEAEVALKKLGRSTNQV